MSREDMEAMWPTIREFLIRLSRGARLAGLREAAAVCRERAEQGYSGAQCAAAIERLIAGAGLTSSPPAGSPPDTQKKAESAPAVSRSHEDELLIKDFSLLVRRLAKKCTDADLAAKAIDFVQRKGDRGNILRESQEREDRALDVLIAAAHRPDVKEALDQWTEQEAVASVSLVQPDAGTGSVCWRCGRDILPDDPQHDSCEDVLFAFNPFRWAVRAAVRERIRRVIERAAGVCSIEALSERELAEKLGGEAAKILRNSAKDQDEMASRIRAMLTEAEPWRDP